MSWRIFEKWFNVAPWKDAEFITNNRGEKFWIHWKNKFERTHELHVWYRGHRVGVVKSLQEEDGGITLADIEIFERYQLRGYGLGEAMMKEFIRWAKENNFAEIWGFIKPHHGTTTKYLRDWYTRQGFVVYEAKPGKYQILLKLKGSQQ